jgi:hypothetical protein
MKFPCDFGMQVKVMRVKSCVVRLRKNARPAPRAPVDYRTAYEIFRIDYGAPTD